ncbi:MAG: mucoidy inhibitor MuiA family protein, partial [Desulfobulbia bacterium]
MWIPAIALTLLVLQVLPSSSEEINSTSEISDVMIFPRGAEVTRTTKLSLVKGNHTVVLRDLPSSVVRNSVRISGKSGGPLNVVSVDTRSIYTASGGSGEHLNERQSIEVEIQKLHDEIAELDGRIRTAELQNKFLESLATKSAENSDRTTTALNLAQDWGGLLDFIASRSNTLNKQILDIAINKRGLIKRLEDLKKKLQNQPPKTERRTEIKVHVVAATPLQGTLLVKYQVRQAGWRPLYDARLYTGEAAKKSDLEITRLAEIYQSSGENWNSVKLSLSTTRPQSVSHAPELTGEKIIAARERKLPELAEQKADRGIKSINKSVRSMAKPMSAS